MLKCPHMPVFPTYMMYAVYVLRGVVYALAVVPPRLLGLSSHGPVLVCYPPCVRIEQGGPLVDGVVDEWSRIE